MLIPQVFKLSLIFVLFEGVPIGSRREDEHLLLIDYE